MLENKTEYFSREQDLGYFHIIQMNYRFESVEIVSVKNSELWSKMKPVSVLCIWFFQFKLIDMESVEPETT